MVLFCGEIIQLKTILQTGGTKKNYGAMHSASYSTHTNVPSKATNILIIIYSTDGIQTTIAAITNMFCIKDPPHTKNDTQNKRQSAATC